MKQSNTIIFILVLLLLFLSPMVRCNKDVQYVEKEKVVTKTDTIFHRDTLRIDNPIPQYIEKVKIDTLYKENGDTVPLVTENKTYKDTICAQNDTAIVTNIIQGINATLLSTEVELKRQELIKTVEITKTIREKPKKFSISPQVGVGYGLFNKKTDVFVGVGISYNF